MRLENRRGSDHHEARFEPREAQALRRHFHRDPGASIRRLSRELEVNQRTVYKVVHGISYQK